MAKFPVQCASSNIAESNTHLVIVLHHFVWCWAKFELCHFQCTYPTSWFFLHSNLVKKTAFWNKRVVLWQLAFWTRKVLGTFEKRARKAIRKITTCLFCKAGLFICCKWNKKKKNCKVSCLETSSFWRYKEYYVSRNTPEKFRDFRETGPWPLQCQFSALQFEL